MKPYRIIRNADLLEDIMKEATWGTVLHQAGCGRVIVRRDALCQDLHLEAPVRSMTWFDFCKYLIKELGYPQPTIPAREPWARAQQYGRALKAMKEFNQIPNKEYNIVRDIWDGFYKQDKAMIVLDDGAMWNVSGHYECWDDDVYYARMLVNNIDPLGGDQWGIISVDTPAEDPTLDNMTLKILDECVVRGAYANAVADLVAKAVSTVDATKKKLIDECGTFFASKTPVPGEA